VPVWTGIGHTGDQSVADIVAGRAFVTPTECGQELVQRALDWWESVVLTAALVSRRAIHVLESAVERDAAARARLSQATRHQLHRHAERLDTCSRRIAAQARQQLDAVSLSVDQRAARIGPGAHRAVGHQAERVASWRRLLAAYDVDSQLARGYTLTLTDDGHVVRSAATLAAGSVLVTRFADGRVHSDVRRIELTGNDVATGAADAAAGEEQI
jgi:exodeoxyribonuclease VII large subunit